MTQTSAQIEELAATVATLARIRAGRVVSITVAVPPEMSIDDLTRILRVRLVRPDLEVRTREGPSRVLSAEFERA